MKHGVTRLIDPTISQPEEARPRASWYTQGRSDGFGDRILMFDNSSAAPLELLRFTPEWSRAATFQTALADRVAALRRFQHASVSDIRGVRVLDGGRVALVSAQVPGRLLSEILAEGGPELALELVRQLAPAMAALERNVSGAAHGALTSDRIVLTPDGTFVITEHALGTALGAVILSPARLAREFGVVSTNARGERLTGEERDIAQLGYVALEVLLGRAIGPSEFETQGGVLLDAAADSTRGEASARRQIRSWLARALPDAPSGFRSIQDASGFLAPRPATTVRPFPVDVSILPGAVAPPATAARAPEPALDIPIPAPAHVPVDDAVPAAGGNDRNGSTTAQEATANRTAPTVFQFSLPSRDWTGESNDEALPRARSEWFDGLTATEAAVATVARPRLDLIHGVAAGLALLAVIQGVAIVMLLRRPAVLTPASRPAAASTIPRVVPASREGGLANAPARKVETDSRPPAARVTIRPTDVHAPPSGFPGKDTVAQAPPPTGPTGTLRITSPMPLHVLEGDLMVGSTDGLLTLSAGPHILDLVNQSLDYHARRLVNIVRGESAALEIAILPGHVSVRSDTADVDVLIDGKPVGEAPIADAALPVGVHEIVAHHAALGERRQEVVVKAETDTAVSLNFRR